MKAYLFDSWWLCTLTAALFLQQGTAAELPADERANITARRMERSSRRPAPTTPFTRLHALYHHLKTPPALQTPTPDWAAEVPEAERNALKEVLKKSPATDVDAAKEMLVQARTLHLAPETKPCAERLFVLAALERAYDWDALIQVSLSSSDTGLRDEARRQAIFAAAAGKSFSHLSKLGIPLPDLTPYKGSPVVIVFWATWNSTFQRKWPEMKESLKTFQESGFKIVGINFDDDEAVAARFIEDEQIEWLSIYPEGHSTRFSSDYGVKSLPSAWIVDEHGNLISTQINHRINVRKTYHAK